MAAPLRQAYREIKVSVTFETPSMRHSVILTPHLPINWTGLPTPPLYMWSPLNWDLLVSIFDTAPNRVIEARGISILKSTGLQQEPVYMACQRTDLPDTLDTIHFYSAGQGGPIDIPLTESLLLSAWYMEGPKCPTPIF